MEATKRATGRHIEYEPNWEYSVRIYISLCTIAPLMLQWCTSSVCTINIDTYRLQ